MALIRINGVWDIGPVPGKAAYSVGRYYPNHRIHELYLFIYKNGIDTTINGEYSFLIAVHDHYQLRQKVRYGS